MTNFNRRELLSSLLALPLLSMGKIQQAPASPTVPVIKIKIDESHAPVWITQYLALGEVRFVQFRTHQFNEDFEAKPGIWYERLGIAPMILAGQTPDKLFVVADVDAFKRAPHLTPTPHLGLWCPKEKINNVHPVVMAHTLKSAMQKIKTFQLDLRTMGPSQRTYCS